MCVETASHWAMRFARLFSPLLRTPYGFANHATSVSVCSTFRPSSPASVETMCLRTS